MIEGEISGAPLRANANALLFDEGGSRCLFVVNGSQVYELSQAAAALADTAMEHSTDGMFAALGIDTRPRIDPTPPAAMPTRAISLAISQKCNLGCTYCYAEGGDFGGPAQLMSGETATEAVKTLIDATPAGEAVTIAFLGGEPLANRVVLRAATEFAASHAKERGVGVGFSITTNGTLVTPADGEFFERHAFAVSVSLDGIGDVHDRQRSFKGGRGSYAKIVERITPLLEMQERMQISARVTITPQNLRVRETLDGLIGLGFHSVGLSPMLSSPTGVAEMDSDALTELLRQMIDCGEAFERHLYSGKRYPFANMVSALREIHKGTHRPYPCGAGGPYLGVSADGDLFACHRFVNDERGHLGSMRGGVDAGKQARWLDDRHVDRQEPCRSCWARYLCGGGCHHEVLNRGRPACDYIRGWLHYCLQVYIRALRATPEFFEPTLTASGA